MTAACFSSRLAARFAALKAEGRAGFVTFLTAGDPDAATSAAILAGFPKAGADLIELGMPFSDPMADGPAIQAANGRALKRGMTIKGVLDLVRGFRTQETTTPLILMGYYNPIYVHGGAAFVKAAKAAGVDGLIVVDLPPEEDAELREPAEASGLDLIRLVAPTTDAVRLPRVLQDASGFLYYVAVTGITGSQSALPATVRRGVKALKAKTDLPVAVGFGISEPEQVEALGSMAEGVVVGSALIRRLVANLDPHGRPTPSLVPDVLDLVTTLSAPLRQGYSQSR